MKNEIRKSENAAIAKDEAERSDAYQISMQMAFKALTPMPVKKDSDVAPPPVIQNPGELFIKRLRSILGRSYTRPIGQLINVQIDDNGDISGLFQDGTRVIQFVIDQKQIITEIVSGRRDDSIQPGLARFDAPRRRKKAGKNRCSVGLSCGNACIEASDRCRISLNKLASPTELQQLQQLAKLAQAEEKAIEPVEPQKDPLDSMTIRELKAEARKAGVSNYSYMTTEELRGAIRTARSSPEQQVRVSKTIERKKAEREAIASVRGGKYLKSWQQIRKITSMSGLSPEFMAASVASILIGVTYKKYQDLRSSYRSGLKESATAATTRAEKIPVDPVPASKPNITFTVGGFAGTDSTGQEIKDRLEAADDWFTESNKVIAFDSNAFDIPPTDIPKKDAKGNYNPLYLMHVATNGIGAAFTNLWKQRNEASVELAAQIYAQARGVKYSPSRMTQVLINPDKTINIVAHGAGGMTAREALDIIAEMPDGKEVLRQINFVALGSPNFGFTDPRTIDREMTITTPSDPWTVFPIRKEKRVVSVPGHEISDYLNNDEVISEVTRFLGKGRTSTYYQERRQEREINRRVRQGKPFRARRSPRRRGDSAYEIAKGRSLLSIGGQ